MKKVPTIFVRDLERKGGINITPSITPGCEWVFAGEGHPTRKRDGTCTMIDDQGRLWKRYDAKQGKTPPAGFVPAQEADPITGHWPGWVLVGNGPEDKYFPPPSRWPDEPGTYEFCGIKVNGNPEGVLEYTFFRHGAEPVNLPENWTISTFTYLRDIFWKEDDGRGLIEGIVWHHPDGRMAKIKRRDFGFAWPVKR